MSTTKSDQHAEHADTTGNTTAEVSNVKNEGNTEYVAPFYPFEGKPLKENFYMVTLQKGYTAAKHWEAIGEDLGVTVTGGWYSARISDEQRERIRRDPGVKEITQYGRVIWG